VDDSTPAEPTRRVTLADVAAKAGVSVSAVSFVLNGRTDQRISERTEQRVQAAADELGYRPNLTARTLRTGRSGTIALVSDFISTTSVANAMVRGALLELDRRDTMMFAVETQGEPELENRLLHSLLARDVDGVIYAAMFTRVVEVPPILTGLPLVLLNCVPATPITAVPAVVPDEQAAGRAAARVLLDAGHRDRIQFLGTFPPGMVGAPRWHGWQPMALADRLNGLGEGLRAAGASLAGCTTVTDWEVADGVRAATEALSATDRPTALVCANDRLALGALRAARDLGLRVPADLSVVSFDGSPLAEITEPPLSSFALPQEEMGRQAADLVLATRRTRRVHRVPMPLTGHTSVAAPA
jgi:LacI family transcriptional regulator